MDPATAAEAFASDPGRQVSRKPAMVRVRRAVSHGLRVLRVGGNHLSYWDIARLTGAPNSSSVIHRCDDARRRYILTKSQIAELRGPPRDGENRTEAAT